MSRLAELLKKHNINCEQALGRGKSDSGVLSKNASPTFTAEQLETLKRLNLAFVKTV